MSLRLKSGFLFLAVLACAFPTASFGASVSFSQATFRGASSNLHADLNGDGREDFVYTNGKGEFVVQLSTGDGTYAAPVAYTLPGGESAFGMGIGDFNGDGKPDLVVFGSNNDATKSDLFLYLNNGKGSFSKKAAFTVDTEIDNVAIGDFNHDGILDVAFIDESTLKVWFGNGKGGFTAGPNTPIFNSGNLMIGDFDGDGYADLAIGDYTNFNSVQVLYGDGTGKFPAQSTIQLNNGHSLFGATDVNSDGRMDIVVSTFYPNNPNYISVYYGEAHRTWTEHTTIPISHCASNTATPIAADVNGDGINDLIVPESDCKDFGQATQFIGVLTRNKNGTYNPDQIVYKSSSPSLILGWPTVLRADRNTKPDIALSQCTQAPCSELAHYELKVLLNTTAGSFPSCAPPDAYEGIDICSPVAHSAASSPVSFQVGAAGPVAMREVEAWADGEKLVEKFNGYSNYASVDLTLDLGKGNHTITIDAVGWDNSLQKKSFQFDVY
jgi:hypothetical protein